MPSRDSRGADEPMSASPSSLPSSIGEITFRKLDKLRPNPRNARTHRKQKIRDLANLILRFGFIGAIIIDENGLILAGHARYAAAKLLGFSTVPTIRVNGL